jgi:hypothetical protein
MIELKFTGNGIDDLAASLLQVADVLRMRHEGNQHMHEMLRLTSDEMHRLFREFGKVEDATSWLLDCYGEARLQDVPIYYWPEIAEHITAVLLEAAK